MHENTASHVQIFTKFADTQESIKNIGLKALILIMVESLVLCFLLSSFSISNILGSPLSKFSQNIRTGLICASLSILLYNLIATRKNQLTFASSFLAILVSSTIFSQSLFWTSFPISIGNASFTLLRKIFINVCFIDTLINSAVVSFLISYSRIYIYNLNYYSQAIGLFSFLKNKGRKDLNNGTSIFFYTILLNMCILIFYLFFIHTPWQYISLVIRVSPYISSVQSIIVHLIKLGVTNTIFYFTYLILDRIVQFNISFYYEDVVADASAESIRKISFHKALSQYKKREIRLKFHTKQIKIIEEYIDDQLTLIEQTLVLYNRFVAEMDAATYVTVPQAQKNYIKKYYGLDIFEFVISSIRYYTSRVIYSLRFKYIIDNFLDIYEAIYIVRNQENIILLSDHNRDRMTRIIEKGSKIDIFKASLAEMRLFINKLN